jgi:hypothetical protein
MKQIIESGQRSHKKNSADNPEKQDYETKKTRASRSNLIFRLRWASFAFMCDTAETGNFALLLRSTLFLGSLSAADCKPLALIKACI